MSQSNLLKVMILFVRWYVTVHCWTPDNGNAVVGQDSANTRSILVDPLSMLAK